MTKILLKEANTSLFRDVCSYSEKVIQFVLAKTLQSRNTAYALCLKKFDFLRDDGGCRIAFCKFWASRANQEFTRSDSAPSGYEKKFKFQAYKVYIINRKINKKYNTNEKKIFTDCSFAIQLQPL